MLKFNGSLVSSRISCNVENMMHRRVYIFAYIMRLREINLRHMDLHSRIQFHFLQY